jgi:hypothetical protein
MNKRKKCVKKDIISINLTVEAIIEITSIVGVDNAQKILTIFLKHK